MRPSESSAPANARSGQRSAIVAGHICLDIIPEINSAPDRAGNVVVPGALTNIGPAALSTGGAVSNTGLALHRLGIPTRLMGKVGDDLFGHAIVDLVRRRDPALATGMIVAADNPSSYTIVISPPGVDRSFLHCPGANDTFGADDVDTDRLADAALFHFGYPPLMRRMHQDGGEELTQLLRRVKKAGLAVSLDMAHVDVDAPAGQVDWRKLLDQALPYVDLFLPSLDEVFFMLDRPRFEALMAHAGAVNPATLVDAQVLGELASEMIELGVAVAGVKLGDQGMYVRTTTDVKRLASIGSLDLDADAWLGREALAPAYRVSVVGTTGAGDCAIAGFLAATLRGQTPEQALSAATAAGAFNVEVADAVSGIPDWTTLQARVNAGWAQHATLQVPPDWQQDLATGVWHSPVDHQSGSSS